MRLDRAPTPGEGRGKRLVAQQSHEKAERSEDGAQPPDQGADGKTDRGEKTLAFHPLEG